MKTLRPVLLLLVLAFVLNACKKDKDPAPPTKTDLLTAKTWKLTAWTVDQPIQLDSAGTSVIPTDIYNYLSQRQGNCVLDNTIKFNKDKSYTVEQGATKCDPIQDQVYASGTWLFSSDENTVALTITSPVDTDKLTDFDVLRLQATNYSIVELTATTFKYTYSLGSYTFTETLTAQ